MVKQYRDKDWLHEQYVVKCKTTYEMAEMCGVSDFTITTWMDRHGIDRRDRSACQIENRKKPLKMTHHADGYERFFTTINNEQARVVYVHQLVAIANGADPHDLFGGGYDVHHRNEIPWDNRPENLKVWTHEEHRKYHAERQ